VVKELDMIPRAPDGTCHMGAHILISKDAGVDGMVFENAVTFCDEFSYSITILVNGQVLPFIAMSTKLF